MSTNYYYFYHIIIFIFEHKKLILHFRKHDSERTNPTFFILRRDDESEHVNQMGLEKITFSTNY